MIDFDIKKPDGKKMEDWVQALAESVHPSAPVRYRLGSPSMAILVRCPEADRASHYRATSKWKTPDTEARVEIKVGQGHFMFGWGTHPVGEELRWLLAKGVSTSPDDFPELRDLPIMSLAQLEAVQEKCEKALRAKFGEPTSESIAHNGWEDVHDLRWDMTFVMPDGVERSMYEVWGEVQRDGHTWVNLTPWRPDSDSGAGHAVECQIHPGYPAIFDFARYTRHFFDLEHELQYIPTIDIPAELVGSMTWSLVDVPTQAQLDRDVERMEAVHRLLYVRELGKYTYCDDPEGSLMTKDAAFHEYAAKEQAELARCVPAVQRLVWDPEQPALTTIENCERNWKEHNTFFLPKHGAQGGSLDGFMRWFEGFIPDAIERQTILLWLANKVQKPYERMFTLVLVGDPGSGKGTFWKLIQRLWGHRVVSQIGNIQALYSQYQDSLYQTLWVLVDEVSLEDATRIGKKLAQERLKAFCEPQAAYKLLNIKGKPQQHAKVCASVGIATNNINALPLDANDRRFYVASTRGEMSRREVEEIHGWMNQDGNIAALWRWLEGRHLPLDFNPMRAPDSFTKETMAAIALTDVEAAIRELQKLVASCGGICTASQAYTFQTLQDLEPEDYIRFRKMFRSSFPQKVFNAGPENGGKTFRGYAVTKEARQASGKRAFQSVLRVTEKIDALQQKVDSESVF